jgi:hypothetical protein
MLRPAGSSNNQLYDWANRLAGDLDASFAGLASSFPFYDARTYGVQGFPTGTAGLTDQTALINAAITDVRSKTGGVIVLPYGDIGIGGAGAVAATVQIPGFVYLMGQGMSQEYRAGTGAGWPTIKGGTRLINVGPVTGSAPGIKLYDNGVPGSSVFCPSCGLMNLSINMGAPDWRTGSRPTASNRTAVWPADTWGMILRDLAIIYSGICVDMQTVSVPQVLWQLERVHMQSSFTGIRFWGNTGGATADGMCINCYTRGMEDSGIDIFYSSDNVRHLACEYGAHGLGASAVRLNRNNGAPGTIMHHFQNCLAFAESASPHQALDAFNLGTCAFGEIEWRGNWIGNISGPSARHLVAHPYGTYRTHVVPIYAGSALTGFASATFTGTNSLRRVLDFQPFANIDISAGTSVLGWLASVLRVAQLKIFWAPNTASGLIHLIVFGTAIVLGTATPAAGGQPAPSGDADPRETVVDIRTLVLNNFGVGATPTDQWNSLQQVIAIEGAGDGSVSPSLWRAEIALGIN